MHELAVAWLALSPESSDWSLEVSEGLQQLDQHTVVHLQL